MENSPDGIFVEKKEGLPKIIKGLSSNHPTFLSFCVFWCKYIREPMNMESRKAANWWLLSILSMLGPFSKF